MVKRKVLLKLAFALGALFSLGTAFTNVFSVQAQDIEYYLSHQWVKIWVNQNGTIDLFYDIEIACTQGTISFVRVGQPNDDFEIGIAIDEVGHILKTTRISEGDYYGIRVDLYNPISAGENVHFSLLTNVGHMIYQDEDNVENVGMKFIPVDWDVRVNSLKIAVVLPEGVTVQEVRNKPDWNNAFHDPEEDNKLVIYWEREHLQPNEKLEFNISFPKEYVDHYEIREKGLDWRTIGILLIGGIIVVVSVFSVLKFRKQGYTMPILRMETLGIRRGLTAVEASHLLGLSPAKIVAEILFSLLMKKVIWVTSTDPVLKIKIVKPMGGDAEKVENQLRYYEIVFLKALKEDGTLDEVKLAETLMLLRDTVKAKLHGYCRQDTVAYYRKIVAKAWEQVEGAGAPELASKAYDENLLWLLLDKNIQSETTRVFKDWNFTPGPDWWWYWYIYTHTLPRPGTKPPTGPPTGESTPPTIPGADFANNIVISIERTSNNIVNNIEKFANSILPPPPPPKRVSSRPARRGASCVCACASCACVCACVSCACACASGGVG